MSNDLEIIRLLLADDHRLVRESIKGQLENFTNIQVAAEAEDGDEICQILEKTEIDVAIIDLKMPKYSGMEVIEMIQKKKPDLPIIALSMMESPRLIRQVMKSGIQSYILKSSIMNELVLAINTVARGKPYFSQEVTKILMAEMTGPPIRTERDLPIEELTKRELEILQLVLAQKSNKEIAEQLYISTRTVEAHKRNLLEKTQSKNIVGLVLYAMENGLS